jgi:hypothetical protein
MVGKNVTGTNDHQPRARFEGQTAAWIFKLQHGCKAKTSTLKLFQTAEDAAEIWNDSKKQSEPSRGARSVRRSEAAGPIPSFEPRRPFARPIVSGHEFKAESVRCRSLIIQVGYETFHPMPRYLMRVGSE